MGAGSRVNQVKRTDMSDIQLDNSRIVIFLDWWRVGESERSKMLHMFLISESLVAGSVLKNGKNWNGPIVWEQDGQQQRIHHQNVITCLLFVLWLHINRVAPHILLSSYPDGNCGRMSRQVLSPAYRKLAKTDGMFKCQTDLSHTHWIKINSKWIMDLNVKLWNFWKKNKKSLGSTSRQRVLRLNTIMSHKTIW